MSLTDSIKDALAGAEQAVVQAEASAVAAEDSAIAQALAAAFSAVTQAEAAALADVGIGEASAAIGKAEAEAVYQLTNKVYKDGVIESIPALLALEASGIAAGMAAYVATDEAAKAINKEMSARIVAAENTAAATYQTDINQCNVTTNNLLGQEQAVTTSIAAQWQATQVRINNLSKRFAQPK